MCARALPAHRARKRNCRIRVEREQIRLARRLCWERSVDQFVPRRLPRTSPIDYARFRQAVYTEGTKTHNLAGLSRPLRRLGPVLVGPSPEVNEAGSN